MANSLTDISEEKGFVWKRKWHVNSTSDSFQVFKKQAIMHNRHPGLIFKPKPFTKLTFILNSELQSQIQNAWWQQVTFLVATAHWIEINCRPTVRGLSKHLGWFSQRWHFLVYFLVQYSSETKGIWVLKLKQILCWRNLQPCTLQESEYPFCLIYESLMFECYSLKTNKKRTYTSWFLKWAEKSCFW